MIAYDFEALCAEKDKANAEVQAIGEALERGFARIDHMRTTSHAVISEYMAPFRVLDNYEITGRGETREEAIKAWQEDMKRAPFSGQFLCWRVKPETDWSVDFLTQKILWRVYARFAAK